MSNTTPADVLLSGDQTQETNYEELLLGLAKSQDPEAELSKALRRKSTDTVQWKNPLIQNKKSSPESKEEIEVLSINTIFRIAQIVQGTLQSELKTRIEKISEEIPVSDDPQQNRRALQSKTNAASLICSLTPKGENSEPIQNWEASSRAIILTDLKTRTIVRAAMACESIFEQAKATPETQEKMEEAIKFFRSASRTFEISLAAKNNTQAGPGKASAQIKGIPPKAVEIIACLTQISLECLKDNAPQLPEAEEKTLRGFQAQCRRAFGLAYAAGNSDASTQQRSTNTYETLLSQNLEDTCPSIKTIRTLWENWKTKEEEPTLEKVSEIIEALYLEAGISNAGKEAIISSKTKALSNGFEAEEPSEKEWITIRELEKVHSRLEKELEAFLNKIGPGKEGESQTSVLLKNQAPITLRAFAALKRETSGLGKASQMVLLGKILGSKTNQKRFEKSEEENPENTLEAFGFIKETKILQQEAGRTLTAAGFGTQERNQLEELVELATNLDYAESILYSPTVLRTLHNGRRTKAEKAARRVLINEDKNEDLEPELRKIYERVKKILDTLDNTLKTHGNNIEALPKMLRDHEGAETLNTAIARLIQTARTSQNELAEIAENQDLKAPIRNAAKSLLDIAEKTQGEDGINPTELADINKRIVPNSIAPKESLGRIIANLTERRGTNGEIAEIEEVAKIITIQPFGDLVSQITKEEAKSIVERETTKTKRDNEAPFTKLKTSELAAVAKLTNHPDALRALKTRYQNQFLRDIQTIRRWREKTSGMTKKEDMDLAVALCKTPNPIREACASQILRNLESCTQPPLWNDHASMPKEEVDKASQQLNQNYSILRSYFKNNKKPSKAEQELMGTLQQLQALTEEIHHKSTARMVRAELLAESLSENGELRKAQIQSMEQLLNLGENSKMIEPAIQFLQSWGAYTGNRSSLLKNAILLPKERKPEEKVKSAGYLASTLEVHISNLKSLRDYMSAVIQSPEALAETYLQFERSKRDLDPSQKQKSTWVTKMREEIKKAQAEAETLETEVETMTNLFEAKVAEAKESNDELAKEEFLHPRFYRAFDSMISQKEKQIQNLHLRANRIKKLIQEAEGKTPKTTSSIPSHKEKEEKEENIENTLARALDAALSAKQQKLVLPKQIEAQTEVGAKEILDASLAQERIKLATAVITQTAEKLRETHPRAQIILDEFTSTQNITETCLKLKEALFEAVKNCEMHTAQSKKRESEINPVLSRLKSKLLSENPELENEQKKWRASLSTTLKHLNGACQELTNSQITKPEIKTKKAEDPQREPAKVPAGMEEP